jgi:hypothetical protein
VTAPTTAFLAQAKKMGLSEDEAHLFFRLATDRYGEGMPGLLRIRDKDQNLVPFRPTRAHKKLARNMRRRNYWVKPRQVWATSFRLADAYLNATEGKGSKCLFINLDAKVTEDVFTRVKTFQDEFTLKSILPKPTKDATLRMTWDNGGSFDAKTVNNEGGVQYAGQIGRSCTVQDVHVTECAYMLHFEEFMNGLEESLPKNGRAVFESTGNGAQGGFWAHCWEIYTKGQQVEPNVWVLGDKCLCFIAWWEHDEYTADVDPLPEFADQFTAMHRKLWDESEAEHLEELRKDASLTEEFIQKAIYWRRGKLLNKGFLKDPEAAIAITDQEYPANIYHAFQSTGSAFFSLSLTNERFEQAKQFNKAKSLPLECRMVNIKGEPFLIPGAGEWLMWDAPWPKTLGEYRHLYCVGADIGGGNADSDPDCIWVKNRMENRYVAVAHGRFGPAKAAEMIRDVAKFYNDADISFENNNHGVGVQMKLHEWSVPNVFRYDPELTGYHGYGFQTNERTRTNGLHRMKSVYEDRVNILGCYFEAFYDELRTFRSPPGRTQSGEPRKPVAQSGKHDDTITGMMVCEALDAVLPPPEKIEFAEILSSNQVGYLKQMALNPPARTLANVL